MKKVYKWLLCLSLYFVLLFPAFLFGSFLTLHFHGKDQQRNDAWSAQRVMECTELVREGLTEDAIRRLDNVSSGLLFRSAYDQDYTEMKELHENILAVWQDAKIYYEKYDVQGGRHSMVGPVENKLSYVPYSWRERTRRQFEAKYKGPTPQVVPELEIVKWFGPELSFAENRGNVVLLDFWGTQCGPCLKGMPKVQKLYEAYKDKGLVVVAMTSPGDNDEAIQNIISENNYTFHVAKAKMPMLEEYAIAAIPTYYLIDKQGRLVWGPEHDTPSVEMIEELLK